MKKFIRTMLPVMLLATIAVSGLKAQTLNGILVANPESLSFETQVFSPVSETVQVSVLNQDFLSRLLSPLITVEIKGTNANQFTIDSNNVDVVDILESLLNGNPVDIEVTYNPINSGTHFATLNIGISAALGINISLLNVNLVGVAH